MDGLDEGVIEMALYREDGYNLSRRFDINILLSGYMLHRYFRWE